MMAEAGTTLQAGPVKEANNRSFRLDPYQAAGRIRFNHNGAEITLDRTGVSVKMVMAKSGLPLSFALPARSFKGIAARCVEHDDGTHTVSLELHHTDPALCITVMIATDLNDIAADWHAWSRLMKLPMLIVDQKGMARKVANELGAIMVEDPIERRKRITIVKHRPWFLRRRKPGAIGAVSRINAAEIIARN